MIELHLWAFVVPLLTISAIFALSACIGARRTDQPAVGRRLSAMGAIGLFFSMIVIPGVGLAAFALPITIAEMPLLPLALVAIAMFRESVALLSGHQSAAGPLDENARIVFGLGLASLAIARIEGALVDSPATVFGAWSMLASAAVMALAATRAPARSATLVRQVVRL